MSYQRLLKIRGIILVWLCLCWQEFPIQIGEETPDGRLSSREAPSPSSSTYHRQGCKLRGDTIYLLSKAERKRVETESSVLVFIFQFHFTVKKNTNLLNCLWLETCSKLLQWYIYVIRIVKQFGQKCSGGYVFVSLWLQTGRYKVLWPINYKNCNFREKRSSQFYLVDLNYIFECDWLI